MKPEYKIISDLIEKDAKVLDVGCGGSPEYYGIKKYKNLTYTGIDITPEMVQFNKEKGINCIEGSANNIPFEDSTFDVVHTRHVLEHMENFIKPIDEMIRVSNKLVLISFSCRIYSYQCCCDIQENQIKV